jgi:hypothetical protein
MALRLTVEERDGSTQIWVRRQEENDPTAFGSPQPFMSPLSIPDFEDLRFYLEDYASLPVGEYAARGERVENERLAAWGEALFKSVFDGDERRDAYRTARDVANRGEPVAVAIRSNNPRILGN